MNESFFELVFPEVSFNLSGETMVNCPFPHPLPNGQTFYESNPSMGINLDKGVFHCFSCGAKGNEIQFISQYMNIDYKQAHLLKQILDSTTETPEDWKLAMETLRNNEDHLKILTDKYHISEKTIQELQIGLEGPGKGFAFPVFLFDRLVDVISYNPGHDPKVRKRANSNNGFIMPYDIWKKSHKHTCIVAGQKDLAIARSNDLNAIAITGGEGEIPELFLNEFKDRTVFIIYDNDEPGRIGAQKVAVALKPYTSLIKIIDLSSICTEKGEDLWDFFCKYNKTKSDLVDLINDTKDFDEEDYQKAKEITFPTVTLKLATSQKYLNKTLRSNIQVLATDEHKFLMPTAVEAKKIAKIGESEVKNRLQVGEKKYWYFNENRLKDLFYLIDSNLKEKQIKSNLKSLLRLPLEVGLALQYNAETPVYKCSVTDHMEATNLEDTPEEYVAYSIGTKLESGKKYKVTYKLVPHPLQGNTLIMVIFDVEESQDAISNFKIDKDSIESLKVFQQQENETLSQQIDRIVEKTKGLVKADYDETLLKTIDLWYHTPLLFDLGSMQKLRAYLDVLIISESRLGKTTTVQAFQKAYNLGARIPLNGQNTTIAGIVGGSQKGKNGYQTRAGILPLNHKGAVIFEELKKASRDVLTELTEIRTSGMATITRVNGSLTFPAQVRMLSLTNTKTDGARSKPISSYPNGIEIILDLVGAPEDIARYDIICILPSKGPGSIDPFFVPPKPYDTKEYRDRIHWIWSRKPNQIRITRELYTYTIQKANELNKLYGSYIQIFGTETYIKLLRLATAIAGYVVSTDDSYEDIIVKPEHIDYAIDYLVELYDNEVFRLRQFVTAERMFSETSEEAIKALQRIWYQSSKVLLALENYSTTNLRALKSISGLDDTAFNGIMSSLTEHLFVRYSGNDIVPTERFRKTMQIIKRDTKGVFLRL